MPTPLSMDQINALGRSEFVAHFGAVYEHSPWAAEQAWEARPFADRDALERALREAVERAGKERQLELLRLHPRLGTRKPLTASSQSEQQGAGLTTADASVRAELDRLNREYEARFGFPFILAVRHATVPAILDSFRTRMKHDVASEFDESLRQVHLIARFRLSDLVVDGGTAQR